MKVGNVVENLSYYDDCRSRCLEGWFAAGACRRERFADGDGQQLTGILSMQNKKRFVQLLLSTSVLIQPVGCQLDVA